MSTAHAKARLSNVVEEEDANAAIELVQFAYFKRILEKEKKKRRRHNTDSGNSDGETSDVNSERETRTSKNKKRKARLTPGEPGYDPYELNSDDDSYIDDAIRRVTRTQVTGESSAPIINGSASAESMVVEEEPATITEERFVSFHGFYLFSYSGLIESILCTFFSF